MYLNSFQLSLYKKHVNYNCFPPKNYFFLIDQIELYFLSCFNKNWYLTFVQYLSVLKPNHQQFYFYPSSTLLPIRCCAVQQKKKEFKDENEQISKKGSNSNKKPVKRNSDKFGSRDSNQQRIGQRYRFPAELRRAMVHLKAKKFGYYNQSKEEKDKNKTIVICPCCNSCIYTEEISIWQGTTDPVRGIENPFLLSSSSALFFSFIKMAALYLLIIFLICGMYGLVSSLDGNYCGQNPNICKKTFLQLASTYNKYNDPKTLPSLQTHNILCLVAVVISIIFFLIYKRVTHTLYSTINKQFYTQDDYTIFVQNIPIVSFKGQASQIDGKHQKRIKQIFDEEIENWLKTLERNNDKGIEKELSLVFKKKNITNPLKLNRVTSISLCYDLKKYQEQRKLRMQKHLDRVKDPNLNDNQLIKDIEAQLKSLNEMELANAKKFIDKKDINFHLSHFVGKGFVSFEYPQFRDYIMNRFKTGKQVFKLNNQTLTLSVAAHPTDINWTNLNFPDSSRFWRVVASHFIIAMILVFAAGLLVAIDAIKLSGTKEGTTISQEEETFNYALSIVAGILTSLINRGIWEIIVILTDFERHKTTTNVISSQIIKAIVAQFINSALIFYLIQLFLQPPYLSSAGLVVQASTYMIVEGFNSIFFSALNIQGWVRYFKLFFKYGYVTQEKMLEKEDRSRISIYNYQIFFNEDYQLPTFDITGEYVKYLLQIYTCMFFSYLIPVGTLASFAIFGLYFWVDKYKLFKLCSKYKDLGYFLTKVIFQIFEGSLLVFAIGNIIFSTTIAPKNAIDPVNVVSVLLALAYLIFSIFMPEEVEYKILGSDENDEAVLSYSQCLEKTKFTETYWSQNPATMFFEEEDINNPSIFFKPKSYLEIFGSEHIEKLTKKKRYGDNFVEALL